MSKRSITSRHVIHTLKKLQKNDGEKAKRDSDVTINVCTAMPPSLS